MFDIPVAAFSRTAILAVTFSAVVVLVMLVSNLLTRQAAVRRRLGDIGGPSVPASGTGMTLRAQRSNREWARIVDGIEKRGLSLVDSNNERLRTKLIAAGYTSAEAPRIFTLLRLVLTLGLPAIYVFLSLASPKEHGILSLYLLGSILAIFGLYAPNLFISAKTARRQEEIINGFPDALDLMLVCVEAGLGLEAALDRVGQEMALAHPLVAAMLGKVVLELRAGRSRADALRRMADEVQVDEIRSFSTLLIQSDKLGSSIGQTLRVYAGEMREKRRMRAEEKAHRLPVLISIPLVVCMLPTMIGVLMLPAGIRVVHNVLPYLHGG